MTGIDVGFLWKDGMMSDQVGIRVKVEQLLAPEEVPEGELFPRYLGDFRVQVLEEAAPEPQEAAHGGGPSVATAEGEHHAQEARSIEDR